MCSIFLPAGKAVTVTVSVLIPLTTPQGTKDRITFTLHGSSKTSLSVELKVITTLDAQVRKNLHLSNIFLMFYFFFKDATAPVLSWQFGSRCENVRFDSQSCSERHWTMDITAQDWETGILRVQSNPEGLIYRNTYTVGTNDPIRATYLSTCCTPKVSIMACDIAGNQKSFNVDVRDVVLSEASITAIVLGVLLLILLIILLIFFIAWCCRRHKASQDLPTYRSHSRNL